MGSSTPCHRWCRRPHGSGVGGLLRGGLEASEPITSQSALRDHSLQRWEARELQTDKPTGWQHAPGTDGATGAAPGPSQLPQGPLSLSTATVREGPFFHEAEAVPAVSAMGDIALPPPPDFPLLLPPMEEYREPDTNTLAPSLRPSRSQSPE